MRSVLLTTLALAACPRAGTDDSSDSQATSCDVSIDGTLPGNDSSDAYYRAAVEFYLSEADPTATVVADFAGTQSTRDEGTTILYLPDEALEPQTSYEIGLDYCGGQPSIAFTTSQYGLPLEDPASLLGRTWLWDLREARFYEGNYLGDLLQTFAERQGLISVVAMDETTVDLRLAVAVPGTPPSQDYCSRTTEIEGVDISEAPFVSFGPTSMEFQAYLGTIVISDTMVEGTVAPDGSALGGLEIEATIDVRSAAQAIEMDVAEMCDILETYGSACAACPDDGEPYCVSMAADHFDAMEVEVEVDQIVQAYADPRCEEEPE